jgi:hypothetical protein
MRNFLCALGVVLILGASTSQAADEAQVAKAIDAAKAAFEKAVAEQGGWVSTKKLIKDAELTAAKGDTDKAKHLADRAKHEAELSYQQALNEKKAWSEPDYIK